MNKKYIFKLFTFAMIATAILALTSCSTKLSVPDEYSYDDLGEYIKLGKYKDVEYTKTDIQVTQQEIMDYIDTERAENATKKKIKSGTVQSDSVINIDYVGKIDGTAFDGGTGSDIELDMANNNYIDGFAAGILGHSVGETFDINVTFPSNYSSADVAGKAAVFTITVNYIIKETLPEYNDAYVKKYTDYKSMEEYEKAVKETLTKQKKSQQEEADKMTVFNTILDSSDLIKLPKKEYQKRYDSYVSNYETQAEQNDTDLETYVKGVLGLSMDSFYGEAEAYAKKVVKQELVLNSIARKEKIEISNSDYTDYVNSLLEDAGYDAKSYEQTYGITVAELAEASNLYSKLLYSRVMDKVMEYSKEVVAK